MKKIKDFIVRYFSKDKEIEITLFKILGVSGALISIISGAQSILSGISLSGGLIDFAAAFLSILLLWFVDKTGKYFIGYIVTEIGVFMALFAVLFFEMGGLEGSMTYFFAFGLVFSFLMFRGVLLIVMEILEVGFYLILCLYAYVNPGSTTPFENAEDKLIDQMAGIVLSGVGIGLIFLIYIYQYKKQQKIAYEASMAKSQFLANMSHELRTPINMMLGMNEMIFRECNDEVIKEYTHKAGIAGEQLLSQVNQLLEFSKIDAGKGKVHIVAYDLYDLLDNLKAFYEKEAQAKEIELVVNIDEGIVGGMKGDFQKLTQILTNLLSNAVKYTKSGTITLSVEKSELTENTQRLLFSVKDTGIGIKGQELNRIFTAFERADIENNRNIEGTGLGLSIAQTFAHALNTEIKVESKYGVGSRFYFELTQTLASADEETEHAYHASSFIAPDARILAVDDNSMNLDVVKSLLKRTLIKVDTAQSGDECIEKVKNTRFDLILLDYMMPGKDGAQTLKELRTIENGDVPIIVLTADVSEGKRELLLSEGFDAYVSKPIETAELERNLFEKLPQNLVIKTSGYTECPEALALIKEEEQSLRKYDISLRDGLKHMGNDLSQYVRISSIFVEGFAQMGDVIAELKKANDYDGLIYKIHSLKGNAGNVGASELRATAAKIEEHLRKNDKEYFDYGSEFLMFALKRVTSGLEYFIERYNRSEAKKVLESEPAKENAGEIDVKKSLNEIAEYLERSNQLPAVKLIDSLLESASPQLKTGLEEVKRAIGEIEFEEALNKLETLMASEAE